MLPAATNDAVYIHWSRMLALSMASPSLAGPLDAVILARTTTMAYQRREYPSVSFPEHRKQAVGCHPPQSAQYKLPRRRVDIEQPNLSRT